MTTRRGVFFLLLTSLGFAFFATAANANSTQTEVEVRAKGQGGVEQIHLIVGSTTVATFDLTTDWATYTATVDGSLASDNASDIAGDISGDIAVAYGNDMASTDRGIRVDHITVDGVIYETESPAVLSTGSFNPRFDCKDGYNESDELACGGRFTYDVTLGLGSTSSDQTPDGQTWTTHCGDINANETWSASTVHVVSCPVNVNGKTRLSIEAGAIVKFEPQPTGAGIIVGDGAQLVAKGGRNSPVIFTSNYDDARGGDTNGDRSSSTLRPGRYGTPITLSPGAAVALDRILIDYAAVGLGDIGSTTSKNSAKLELTNSTIQNSFYLGVNFDEPQSYATITRTAFVENRIGAARFADLASITGFGVNGQAGNYFKGTPAARQVYLANVEVPAKQGWTFGPSRGAILTLEKEKSLLVDGKLTVQAGSIIKISTAGVESAITARTGSSVAFQGQSKSPIILTSVLDDTAGGDTNLDGDATAPRKGAYEVAIRLQPGSSVTADYIISKYGKNGIAGERGESETTAKLRVGYSLFEQNDFFGIHVNKAPIAAQIYRSTFKDNRLGGVRFTTGNSPENFYTEGNAKNTFVGEESGKQLWMGGAKLPKNRSFVFAPDAGAVLTLEHNRSLITEGTVVIQPGSIVKVSSNERQAGLHVAETGRAYLNGSTKNPIIITSAVDDSYGGDSNGDGDKAKPEKVGYRTAVWVSPGGVFQANNTEIAYARHAIADQKGAEDKTATIRIYNTLIRDTKTVAIDLRQPTTEASITRTTIENVSVGLRVDSGNVRFRGAFLGTEMDIKACDYNGECSVDAQFVNWGDPSKEGPFVDNVPSACGNVRVSYWKDQSSSDRGVHYTGMNCGGSTFTP